MIKVSKNTIIIATVTVVAAGVGYIVYKNTKKTTKKSSKKSSSKKAVKSNEEDYLPDLSFNEVELDEELNAIEEKVANGEEVEPSEDVNLIDVDDDDKDNDELYSDYEYLNKPLIKAKDPKVQYELNKMRDVAHRFADRFDDCEKIIEGLSNENKILLKDRENANKGCVDVKIKPGLSNDFLSEDSDSIMASIDAELYEGEDESIGYTPSVILPQIEHIQSDYFDMDKLNEIFYIESEDDADECIDLVSKFNSSLSMFASAYLEQFALGITISMNLVSGYWGEIKKLKILSSSTIEEASLILAVISKTVSKNLKAISDDDDDDEEDGDTESNPLVDSLADRMATENEKD